MELRITFAKYGYFIHIGKKPNNAKNLIGFGKITNEYGAKLLYYKGIL